MGEYTDQQVFESMVRLFKRDLPDLQIVDKSKSKLHRFIGWCLKFPWFPKKAQINPYYTTDYWTTIGQTVAYPKEDTEGERFRSWQVLPHESRHAWQAKKHPVLMGVLYLLGTPVPGILAALLSLLLLPLWILVGPWWISLIIIGLGIVLSSPVPFGYFRARYEREAYAVSIALDYWLDGRVTQERLDYYCEHFVDSSYFFMWPIRSTVNKWLDKARLRAISGAIFRDRPHGKFYRKLYKELQKLNKIKAVYSPGAFR